MRAAFDSQGDYFGNALAETTLHPPIMHAGHCSGVARYSDQGKSEATLVTGRDRMFDKASDENMNSMYANADQSGILDSPGHADGVERWERYVMPLASRVCGEEALTTSRKVWRSIPR